MKTKKRRGPSRAARELMSQRMTWMNTMARYLMDEYDGMPFGVAMERSCYAFKILWLLGMGETYFVYIKDDGTIREARGTLNPDEIPADAYKGDGEPAQKPWPRDVYTYWDLEKEAWRSFKVSQLPTKKIFQAIENFYKGLED